MSENWRIEYIFRVRFNGREFRRVVIDQHYRENHPEMDDLKILALLKKLENRNVPLDQATEEFQYFEAEPVLLNGDPYRLILVVPHSEQFIGVVNAFRIDRI